jgi:hypothetical protein
MINRVSFEFSCLSRKNLSKKQHQAMETETPLMLLFICNRTDQASIVSDTKQMLDATLDDIKQNEMLSKEFKNKDIPHFTIHLNAPYIPAKTKSSNNKGYIISKSMESRPSTSKLLKRRSTTSNTSQPMHTG